MSFVPITTGEIESGEPVKNETLNKIKDNFDDHETRLVSAEAGGNVSYPPIILWVSGAYSDFGVMNDYDKTVINFDITITGIRLYIGTAGSAGTTTADVKYKRGAGSYTSVLTTLPSVAYTAGNDAVSTNAVLHTSNKNLLAGDILRLDLTTIQTGGKDLFVRIDYEKV